MRQRTIKSGGGVLGAAEPEKPKPIFPMDGSTYYARIWFIHGQGRNDWMGAVHRKVDSDRWEITYRFRYDAGTESPLDDEKQIVSGACQAGTTEAEAIAIMKSAIDAVLLAGMPGPSHELIINSADLEVIRRALVREEFTNFISLEDRKIISRKEVEERAWRKKGAS